MIAEPEKQQDARGDEKKTMSVKFDDGADLGRFCWIFLRNALKDAEWRTRGEVGLDQPQPRFRARQVC